MARNARRRKDVRERGHRKKEIKQREEETSMGVVERAKERGRTSGLTWISTG